MKKQLWTAVLAVCLCVCMGATASFVSAQEGDFSIELVNGIGVRHGAKKLSPWQSGGGYYPIGTPSLPGFLPPYS